MPFFDDESREKFHKIAEMSNDESEWEPIISIGTAARMLSLSTSAIRKYEKEGLLLYHRTTTGRRLLSRSDITRIKMIQHMVSDLGLNMEGIRRLLALLPCWKLKPCTTEDQESCHAMKDHLHPCWMTDVTECARNGADCRSCTVYRYGAYCTDVIKQLLYADDEGKT